VATIRAAHDGLDRSHQRGEPPVEMRHARQEMQDPLVDAQPRKRQRRVDGELDQTPAAERRGRRQRVPMGVGRHRQCQTEGRIRSRQIAVRGGAKSRHLGIELDAGAQQQDQALESGQVEQVGDDVERRRVGVHGRAAGRRHICGRRLGVARASPQRLLELLQGAPQIDLVHPMPIHDAAIVHRRHASRD
jgi:hypothetical protein